MHLEGRKGSQTQQTVFSRLICTLVAKSGQLSIRFVHGLATFATHLVSVNLCGASLLPLLQGILGKRGPGEMRPFHHLAALIISSSNSSLFH